MNIVRRTLDIDSETDARLNELAAERGQDVSAVLAEAVALLDSVVDIGKPDIEEDRRRLREFRRTREALPLHPVSYTHLDVYKRQIKDRDEYLKKQSEAQFAVKETEMVEAVRQLLALSLIHI